MSNILFFKSQNSSRGGLQVGLEIISVDKVIEGKRANRYGYINGHIDHISRMSFKAFQEAFPDEEVAKKMALQLGVSAKIKDHYHPLPKVKAISSKLVKRGTVVKTKGKYPETLLYLGEAEYTDTRNVSQGFAYVSYSDKQDYSDPSFITNVRIYKTKKPAVEIIKEDIILNNEYERVTKNWIGDTYTYKLKLKNEQ